jgi:hypothetical protein
MNRYVWALCGEALVRLNDEARIGVLDRDEVISERYLIE